MRQLRISLFLLLLLLPACRDRSLEERTKQVRQWSDQQDRVFSSEALHKIERTYWTRRDGAWYGKLPDGTIVRLDAPHAEAASLPSRAFYSGWHLQLTLTSEDWRTYPAVPHEEPFQAIYAITRHSATNWQINVTGGRITTPLSRDDLPRIED